MVEISSKGLEWIIVLLVVFIFIFVIIMTKYNIVSEESLDRVCREIIPGSMLYNNIISKNIKCIKGDITYEIGKYTHIPDINNTKR